MVCGCRPFRRPIPRANAPAQGTGGNGGEGTSYGTAGGDSESRQRGLEALPDRPGLPRLGRCHFPALRRPRASVRGLPVRRRSEAWRCSKRGESHDSEGPRLGSPRTSKEIYTRRRPGVATAPAPAACRCGATAAAVGTLQGRWPIQVGLASG